MTESQAVKAAKYWGEKVKHSDFTETNEDGLVYLTRAGQLAKDDLLKYSSDEAYTAMAIARRQQWPVWSMVEKALRENAKPRVKVTLVPEELGVLGDGRVVEILNTGEECYGITDLSEVCPCIWVLQTRGTTTKRLEWCILPVDKYKSGIAEPVSKVRGDQLKSKWRQMDKDDTIYNEGPRMLYLAERIVPGSAIGTVPPEGVMF